MLEFRTMFKVLVVLICLCVGGLLAGPASAFEERANLSADMLILRNLIGQIEVEGHEGADFEIEIHVQGSDATPDRVRVEIDDGRKAEVNIRFPLDESKHYVYPKASGETSFSIDDGGSWLAKLFGSGNIKISKSGRGLEIWADATVRVPRGKSLIVDHGAGTIVVNDVEGDLELGTHSGPIEVDDVEGSVSVDTGSGRVTVANINGNLLVDTGSGSVTVRDVRADSVHVDTGSGNVSLEGVDGSTVYVDTGSGGVKAEGIGADDLTIDTGSGSVSLQLDRMGSGSFVIDTGSGGIQLQLPENASARVSADTGSGGVRLDLAGKVRMHHEDDDEAEFTIGDGAASITLDTGSGSIRVSQ